MRRNWKFLICWLSDDIKINIKIPGHISYGTPLLFIKIKKVYFFFTEYSLILVIVSSDKKLNCYF